MLTLRSAWLLGLSSSTDGKRAADSQQTPSVNVAIGKVEDKARSEPHSFTH